MIVISIDKISKKFDDLEVINDISLSVKEGEIICILGGSGCGKTTILNMISGMHKPDSGSINASIKIPSKDIGYMLQADQLLPWRTAKQNISLGLELTNSKKTNKIDEVLDIVGLSDLSEYYPNQLSGGQKQRVSLARTMAISPKLLLLDEPLSALDLVNRDMLSKEIKSYVKKNKSGAIVVTHSVVEAIFLADIIHILSPRPSKIFKSFSIVDDGVESDNILLRDNAYSHVIESLKKAVNIS